MELSDNRNHWNIFFYCSWSLASIWLRDYFMSWLWHVKQVDPAGLYVFIVCVYIRMYVYLYGGGKIEKSAIICWPYYWVSQKWFSLCECSSPNTEWADNLLSHTYIGHWWTREKKWLLHFLVFLLLFGFFFSLSLKWIKLHILPFLPPLYTKYSTVWVYLSLEDSSWPHI